jgi:hypothetical protein
VHSASFIAHTEASTGAELPRFIKDEFDAFLECSVLAHGFLRLRCGEFGHDNLLAFSCSGRGSARRAGRGACRRRQRAAAGEPELPVALQADVSAGSAPVREPLLDRTRPVTPCHRIIMFRAWWARTLRSARTIPPTHPRRPAIDEALT